MKMIKTELLKQVLNSHNFQPFVLLKDYSNLPQLDRELRIRLYENYSYEDSLRLIDQNLQPGQILVIKDDFQIYYFMLRIPGEFCQDYQLPLFLSGPFLDKRLVSGEIRRIMADLKLPDRLFRDLMEHYNRLPVVTIQEDRHYLENLISGFFEMDYEMVYAFKTAHATTSDRHPEIPNLTLDHGSDRDLRKNPKIAETNIDERYQMENKLMEFVRKGDYSNAKKLFDEIHRTILISPRTENQLRNQQNFTIIIATLLRKAAEQGGVPPVYIDEISSRFSIRINEARSLRELDELRGEMVHRYCLLVQNHSMKGLSPVIRDIVTYIDFHYAEDLNLSFFAGRNNLSRTYLSGMFKKELGMPLTDYIHSVRMRQALVLINTGGVSMSVIASTCGYSDLNYFIRMFKRTYNMTPKQYQQVVMQKR